VSLYKQPLRKGRGSPNWYARVYLPFGGRSIHTRSTGTTDVKVARAFAQTFFQECLVQKGILDGTLPAAHEHVRKSKLRFDRIVDSYLDKLKAEMGDDPRLTRNFTDYKSAALGKSGFATYFGKADVNTITYERINDYIAFKHNNSAKGKLAGTSIKRTLVLLGVILKFAFNSRLLERMPPMPKVKTKDNPRAWFDHDEYRRLHLVARMRGRQARKNGMEDKAFEWEELSDFIIFMVGSFLRPGEWPALQNRHVKVVDGPNPYLELSVIRSKTNRRRSVTMSTSVNAYRRMVRRNGDGPDVYLFKPSYLNRQTAKERMADAFDALVSELGLKFDVFGNKRATYSLRHTALMLRFTKGDNVNILALAKNAGTSVDQLERFYLSRINTADHIANLQSFR
jgi:hypothetical protein